MKRIIPTSLFLGLMSIASAFAAVPSLINYQGRLTDTNGDPVTGTKTVAVSIYDASSGGNLLYSEATGSVTLDDKGIYSFQFGGTGTSNTSASETVATTDGALSTFNKVLTNTPIVAGSLSVTAGTYTWDQTNGSSNESEFGVIYNDALGRATVVYYSGAPAAGTDISATYRYGVSGITGALSSGGEHWLELSVDGVAQTTRDRVLTVPFAMNANHAKASDVASSVTSFDESLLSLSTPTVSDLLDQIAFSAGTHSASYIFESFTSLSGSHGLVDSNQLLLSWDQAAQTMTTRAFFRDTNSSAYLNKTWDIGRYVSHLNLRAKFAESNNNTAAKVKFNYRDGTSSETIYPSYSYPSFQSVANPSLDKIVNSIKVWGGDGSRTAEVDFTPVFLTSDLHVEIIIGALPDSIYALRVLAEGVVTNSGVFGDCCEWSVRYSDGSFSGVSSLATSINLDQSKTASAIRLSIKPSVLGANDLDISKILVRKLAK